MSANYIRKVYGGCFFLIFITKVIAIERSPESFGIDTKCPLDLLMIKVRLLHALKRSIRPIEVADSFDKGPHYSQVVSNETEKPPKTLETTIVPLTHLNR